MKQKGYIGLDVGTSGCKASILDGSGRVLVSARRSYPFVCPRKGYVELDPAVVWQKVCETLREIASAGIEAEYLAVSSIGEAMVLLDGQDRILYNGITYLDERGPETLDIIREMAGEERAARSTWLPLRLYYSVNRWLWLKEHEPGVTAQTDKIFLFGDYITYMLTGERMIDPSTASKTYLLGASERCWDRELCSALDFPADKLCAVVPTGTLAGPVRPQIAEELGLPASLKVVVGVHDQDAATIGAGCLEPGDMAAGEGSSESLNLVIRKAQVTPALLRESPSLEPYADPELFLIPSGQHAHGTAIRWFLEEFGADLGGGPADPSLSPYDIADMRCAEDADEVLCLPYLTRANLMDSENRALGMFLGLKVGATRAQMYRALLEGLCFETRRCFDLLGANGLYVRRIVATGGCSKSSLLMQMKADVLGVPVRVLKNADAGITGMAMVCAAAAGEFGSLKEAAEQFVHYGRVYEPRRDYTERYEKYCAVHAAAKQLYAQI